MRLAHQPRAGRPGIECYQHVAVSPAAEVAFAGEKQDLDLGPGRPLRIKTTVDEPRNVLRLGRAADDLDGEIRQRAFLETIAATREPALAEQFRRKL